MNCKWISDPSGLVIQGCKIKRGFFYLGEAFPVYNKKRLLGDVGRKTNVQFLKEPVIDPSLPISESKTRKKKVVSYCQMDSYQRFIYLKWLAGEIDITHTPEAIITYHLWVISVRIFCDDECTRADVDAIFEYLTSLKLDCEKMYWAIPRRIALLLSYICLKHFPKLVQKYKAFEHVKQDIAIRQFSSYEISKIEDAYNIWEVCFPKDKRSYKISDDTKKEWWTIACNVVKRTNSGVPLFPSKIKFDSKEYGYNSCFSAAYLPLDFTIRQYSNREVMLYTLLYRCDNEFQTCHKRYKAGLDPCRTILINNNTKSNAKKRKTINKNIIANKSEENKKNPTNTGFVNTFLDVVLSPTQKYAKGIKKNLTSDYQVISVSKILEEVGCNSTNPLIITTKLKVVYQSFFDEGIGMVPSHTYLNRYFKPEDKLIIFQRLPGELYEPDYLYDFVDVFLKLAAYISQGSVTDRERSFVQSFIANKDKRVGNQKQLYAYFLWYLKTIRSINTEIRQCINNDLNAKGRENIAKHLVEYVESDFDTLFTKEHILVNVLPILSSKPFKISEVKRNEALVTIDPNKLSKIKQDTHVAQSFLSDIFDDNEQEVIVKTQDFEHKAILAEILSKDSWERDELSNLCKQKGYILGSLLEGINDYSYNKVGDAIIEDDGDVLYVNVEYKKELL